uniref:Dolichyl-diphosphooligosaccharide--protein glycosyltransferase subunit DAD1 n=1 Tax=Fundulus heteroclitus TaxID=8078 RepID=A0A3Q2QET3_FUNHE
MCGVIFGFIHKQIMTVSRRLLFVPATLYCLFFFPPVCLRIQINPQNKGDFLSISPERAFADFLFAHTVLHLVVMNFIG